MTYLYKISYFIYQRNMLLLSYTFKKKYKTLILAFTNYFCCQRKEDLTNLNVTEKTYKHKTALTILTGIIGFVLFSNRLTFQKLSQIVSMSSVNYEYFIINLSFILINIYIF